MDWDPDFIQRSAMFRSIAEQAHPLSRLHTWPSRELLASLLAAREVANAAGVPLRLTQPDGDAEPYETRIYRRGEMPHRDRSWHDLFNVLVWLTYPTTKAVLNAMHYAATMRAAQETPASRSRGSKRDALTLFDENGAVVLTSDCDLLTDLRERRWKQLFWSRRERIRSNLHVHVFGHGLLQKALRPYIGMSAHALLLPCDQDLLGTTDAGRARAVDAATAGALGALETPRALTPLPVLGLPGWCAENDCESFYENDRYFRPPRTASGRSGE